MIQVIRFTKSGKILLMQALMKGKIFDEIKRGFITLTIEDYLVTIKIVMEGCPSGLRRRS